MVKHVLTWFFKSVAVFLLGIPATLLGLPVVALALPFRIENPRTAVTFSDPRFGGFGFHVMVNLPWWAKPWDNLFDGALGDKRGWWANECLVRWNKPCTAFWSMWYWLAIRNPANYWSRVLTGLDISQCVVTKLAGDDVVEEKPGLWQWQFLVATKANGSKYHRLYCVFPYWFDQSHCVMIDIGWKFKLKHSLMSPEAPIADRIRGSVFTPSLWKKL